MGYAAMPETGKKSGNGSRTADSRGGYRGAPSSVLPGVSPAGERPWPASSATFRINITANKLC